ncbi:hypothetical protein E3E26_09095 [Thermococcus sp. LS1]|uniref:hypothetical protein n=1 Tax=Thermococcus sp. LS1 TaxID=1638259 RepID=UPI00143CAB4C|nr:hypothetical protein [Thermococcus sp. LS1]NJD99931.1 hypothetical protein [Thermococcus sp. LS1]
MSSGLYWFIHDPFSRPGSPDYLGPENWGHIRKAAFKLALPLLAIIWVLAKIDEQPGAFIGFFLTLIYLWLFNAIVSDEVEEARRESKSGWKYGWY